MRILLLCHGLPPDSQGGVEQHVHGLAGALVAAGHDVHLYARAMLPGRPQGEHQLVAGAAPRTTRVAYRWEGVDSLAAMYTCAPMASALRQWLQEEAAAGRRFDVAHVHHLTGMSVDSIEVLRSAGIPVVMTLHDYWLLCPRGQMFPRDEQACATVEPERCGACLEATFPWWLQDGNRAALAAAVHERARQVLAGCAALVVPSARALPPFLALGLAAERCHVVENGVDTEALANLPPPAAGPGPLRLGYFGTVMPSKGLHVLLDAVLALPAGLVSLAIHGNAVPYHGDSSYPLRCFQKLLPGRDIRYHGPYGLEQLPELYGSIDVLAAPALWQEAYGLTVREALAAGRPVLVSRIGGLQDAVADGEQGLLLPPGDVAAWRTAIERLARDRSLVARLARGARSRARGFAPMATELLAIYAEVKANYAGVKANPQPA